MSNWEDRRALFQRGREVHEPGRRPSQSSGTGVVDALRRASTSSNSDTLEKTMSNSSPPASPTSRRRSSAAANGATLFGNLHQHKRGSDDYATRRASHHDQNAGGGLLSGWFNSTFRGVQTSQESPSSMMGQKSSGMDSGMKIAEERKGVME